MAINHTELVPAAGDAECLSEALGAMPRGSEHAPSTAFTTARPKFAAAARRAPASVVRDETERLGGERTVRGRASGLEAWAG